MHRTILAALDAHAARAPEALALDDVPYGTLRAASLRVAARLRAAGVGPGDRLVIYAENRPGFVYAYLGGLRAGAIVVPVNVLYRASDLEHVLGDAEPAAVCVSEQSAPHAAGCGRPTIALADVEAWAADPAGPLLEDGAAPTPDDGAILIYTSGTTGRSKGAELTHGNLAAIAAALVEAWRWTPADTLLLTLPLFHVHGLGAGVNGTLFAGARVLLRERFDAPGVVATLSSGGATMFFGVPTMYVRILEQAPPETRFAEMRLFVSGSAALPAAVHEEFDRRFGVSILERYGSTEFGFALGNRYEGPRYAGTVGFPLPHVDVRLMRADGKAEDAEPGYTGEILVHGPNVFRGYWRNAAATAAAFVMDGSGRQWYRSGDLATFDPDRGYTINGRLKELVITGGFNVYPIEVEDELLRLPGIRAAAVIGRPDAARGEVPVAFVECDPGFDPEAALAALRDRLASFKVPKTLYPIDALPRNAMGKVEKPRLREMLAQGAS